ncbi:YheC/YheD family protein [Pseudalkalibacillus decolorationis]|uniref:YheC/YheD family endospore coat-associated protein n=1 Tax=Pseudalkalibacillus decolorationis TaxID=163879 RepID=UPI00214914D4|nr:YheC/YheD family protein [Pseudalkalibacillus decolorationis]
MNVPQHLRIIEEKEEIVYVPFSLFQRWVEQQAFPATIIFGANKLNCTFHPHPDQKHEFMITNSLAKKLQISEEQSFYVIESKEALKIGPIVGIFTAGFTSSNARPLKDRSIMFAKMLVTARKMGSTAFVFGAHHIDWKAELIYGYTYKNNQWIQQAYPFPDSIYDRLPNRKTESMNVSLETKLRFQEDYSIDWFNPGFFDKWNIHQLLTEAQTVQKNLPETHIDPDESIIGSLLNQYGSVYIKPTNGSLGIGIQHLFKRKDDTHYYCKFQTNSKNRLRRYTSLRRLLHKQFPNGMSSYMAQRGIELISWNGKPIDFRIHTNRDRSGAWRVSAMAAKLAGDGSITTHVTNGGRVLSVQELFHEIGQPKSTVNDIHQIALEISDSLSNTIDGLIGEIGFDLGVDRAGHIWMFEANSKPGRSIFSHPDMKGYDYKTRSLPIEFSIYLFEQRKNRIQTVIQ